MSAGWGQSRKIRQSIDRFVRLIEAGETALALEHFAGKLLPSGADVPPNLRALFHLERSLAEPSQADITALVGIAAAAPAAREVAYVLEALRWLERLRRIRSALQADDAPLLEAGGVATGAPETRDVGALEALERLALALSARRAYLGRAAGAPAGPDDTRDRLSIRVAEVLPPLADLTAIATASAFAAKKAAKADASHVVDAAALGRVRAQLQIWSAMTTGGIGDINPAAADIAPFLHDDIKRKLTIAAALAKGANAVRSGAHEEAAIALATIRSACGPKEAQAAGLEWGVAAADRSPADAASWLDRLAAKGEDVGVARLARLAAGTLRLRLGEAMAGRAALLALAGEIAADKGTASPEPRPANTHGMDSAVLRARCLSMVALSHLSATAAWAVPERDGGHLTPAGRETLATNRALWSNAWQELEPIIGSLAEDPGPLAPLGDLLRGLCAYADGGTVLSRERIARFAVAGSGVRSSHAADGVRGMEATLTLRARATEQAIELIKAGRIAELRDFKTAILERFGANVPTPVHAAIHLVLWQADSTYDPLPALRRLPTTAEDEPLVRAATAEVERANALGLLRRQCLGQEMVAAVPGTASFVGAGEAIPPLVAHAIALVHLRRGDDHAAQASLGAIQQSGVDPSIEATQFVLAWRRRDATACLQRIFSCPELKALVSDTKAVDSAVVALAMVTALERGDTELGWSLLTSLGGGDPANDVVRSALIAFVAWSLRRKMLQPASRLINHALDALDAADASPSAGAARLRYACLLLQPIVLAAMQQLSAVIAAADRVTGSEQPPEAALPTQRLDASAVARVRLLRLQAEVAIAAGEAATGAGDTRWQSLLRVLEQQERAAPIALLRSEADLVTGLLSFILPGAPTSGDTIGKLSRAQRDLKLTTGAAFVERAISQLKWRQEALRLFWEALGAKETEVARRIYAEELVPAYGDRLPPAAVLAGILIDIASDTPARDLLVRLDRLAARAPELPAAILAEAREQIREGEKYREVARLLETEQFEALLVRSDQIAWQGVRAGSKPFIVAVADLVSLVKSRQGAAAEKMATAMSRDDYAPATFLLGYIAYGLKKHDAAVKAFSAVLEGSRGTVMFGHDVRSYLAAASYSQGLALLEVDNKAAAFEALGLAFAERRDGPKTAGLTSVFLQVGHGGLRERNARTARQAFDMALESLNGADESWGTTYGRIAARLGLLLTDTLQETDTSYLDLLGLSPGASLEEALAADAEFRAAEERQSRDTRAAYDKELADGNLSPEQHLEFVDRLATDIEKRLSRLQKLARAFSGLQARKDELRSSGKRPGTAAWLDALRTSPDRFLQLIGAAVCAESEEEKQQLAILNASVRAVAICQELRRRNSVDAPKGNIDRVREWLISQADELEAIAPQVRRIDPRAALLKFLAKLLLGDTSKRSELLVLLERAHRLGVHSSAFNALIERHRKTIVEEVARNASTLDLFDLYLTRGDVEAPTKAPMLQHAELSELYRINRGYVPSDIALGPLRTGLEVLDERVTRLLDHARKIGSNSSVPALVEDLDGLVAAVRKNAVALLAAEKKLLGELVGSLKSDQSEGASAAADVASRVNGQTE